MPGDDLRDLDWKVYARSDRYYVKKFEEETNLDCHLLLDVSGSMGYGAQRAMTQVRVRRRASPASLGLPDEPPARRGRPDRVRRAASSTMLPASARPGHLHGAAGGARSAAHRRSAPTSSKPLHQLADALTKRGMVVLISDLLDDPDEVIRGLKHFQFRGTDVIVFHVLDPTRSSFRSSARRGSRISRPARKSWRCPASVREHYLKEMGALIERYRRELGAAGIDYQLVDTSQPLEIALLAYLSTRARAL